ncbi:MAG: rhodanese-like domain-containing protein [Pseudomonadota bacterium]
MQSPPSSVISGHSRHDWRAIFVAILAIGVDAVMVMRASPSLAQDRPTLTSAQAHAQAAAGSLVIVDIRAPREWASSGVASNARLVTMYQPRARFAEKIKALQASDRRVALICAGGVRSRQMQAVLARAGVSGVVDIRDGMLGGLRGRGWIKSGLPTRRYSPRAGN